MKYTLSTVLLLALTAAACGAAEENVFAYDTFDDGALDQRIFERGELVASPTANSSKGALKASVLQGNQWFGIGISRNLRQRPKTKVGQALFFRYRCEKTAGFKIQINCDSPNGNIVYSFRSVPGIWVPMHIPFAEMQFSNNMSADANGVELRSINIYGGKPGESFEFCIDDLALYYDNPPEPLAADIALQKKALAQIKAGLSQQRYVLSQELIYRIRAARAAAEPPTAKTIMTAGSTSAATMDFIVRMRNDDLKGCTFVSTSRATGKSKDLNWIKENLERHIPREKPEIVFLLPGPEDVLAGRDNAEISKTLGEIVDLCLASGTAIVLCSSPERLGVQTPLADAASRINSIISVVADGRMVPFLDSAAIANADQKRNFSGLKPGVNGYKAINERALPLYTAIEHWAFDRRPETPAEEPGKPGEHGKPDVPKDVQKSLDEIEI